MYQVIYSFKEIIDLKMFPDFTETLDFVLGLYQQKVDKFIILKDDDLIYKYSDCDFNELP